MSWRSLAIVGGVGAAGAVATLLIGVAGGMGAADLVPLAVLMAVAVAATMGMTALVGLILQRASFRRRLLSVTLAGMAVSLVNLVVIALLMFISAHDAAVMVILLSYAGAVGIASALALARGPAAAVARLGETAARLAAGDLDARVGPVQAGRELDALARTLDDMAEQLQRSIVAERGAESRRRDLMTAVSHDLRTPLAGLRAMVEAIEDEVIADPPTLRRYATEMRRAVGSLSALVDDLFELSQLDAGAIETETRRARLAEIVDSALAACETQMRDRGVVVETDLAGAEEALCSPRLTRVLQNLLQNAIRHTPSDGGSVRVEAQRSLDRLRVAVQDHGEGIPEGSLQSVFEPFWRGDTARSSSGSGLGLALASRIVHALGGDIRVESAPAQGARFEVLLPV